MIGQSLLRSYSMIIKCIGIRYVMRSSERCVIWQLILFRCVGALLFNLRSNVLTSKNLKIKTSWKDVFVWICCRFTIRCGADVTFRCGSS